MCHHTHSDYRVFNPPLRLAGRVRGLRMICHTRNNPAPSISTPRWEVCVCVGWRLVLLLSLLSLYTLPRIRLVAPADMWTDSCQQDVLKQKSALQARITPLPLGCPWSAGQLIPYHCFAGFCLLQRVSVTSLVLTSAHQQTTPVFIFVCEIPAEKHSQMGTSRCQWHTRVNR